MNEEKQYWLDENRWRDCVENTFKDSDAYQRYGEELDEFVAEEAERLAAIHVRRMDEYLHGDKDIPGCLRRIDLNWNLDHKDGPTFDEVLALTDKGWLGEEHLAKLRDWTEEWWFKAFGTFGLKYNFGYAADDYILENRRESFMNSVRYRCICLVQSGEDLAECERLFQGDAPEYMVGGYSQPVIDYLRQWDADEWQDEDITADSPRTSPLCTEYPDESGVYTLVYDNSLGGVFMLYREATWQEKCKLWDDMDYDEQIKYNH